jgi:hypothetical protein
MEIGKKIWAIAEGYIPSKSTGEGREFKSHETACILNTSDRTANIQLTIYFADKDPVGPYQINVPAKRTYHFRFNDLTEPLVPRDTDYSSVFVSDTPVVIQHTRLDSRQAELGLLSTIAFSMDSPT